MENGNDTGASGRLHVRHDLGTFEGFDIRSQKEIPDELTADEVVNWDHKRLGAVEFRPTGDREEMWTIFSGRRTVTAGDLLALDRLLSELGGDSVENFLRIYHTINRCGCGLGALTTRQVQDTQLRIFLGSDVDVLRRKAADRLFEHSYPESYAAWRTISCDAVIFDVDRFLDSMFIVEEIDLGDQVALLITDQ
jgi:hypothetical protein